jgi:hypothetical protein
MENFGQASFPVLSSLDGEISFGIVHDSCYLLACVDTPGPVRVIANAERFLARA